MSEPATQEALLDAIHGSGAFRVFRGTLDRLGLRDRWYAYRQDQFERKARDWLEANHVPYR